MPQYNEFVNYQTPYPPKPRSMWELGFGGGYHMITGADVKSAPGFGGTVSLRKALGHVISIRGAWTGSFNYGFDGQRSYGSGLFTKNDANPWQPYLERYKSDINPNIPGLQNDSNFYSANYKNATHLLSVDVIASLNNWSHHRGNPKWDWYLFAGPGVYSADVDVDARDANGALYNYEFSDAFWSRDYKDIRKDLKDKYDGKYESNAPYEFEGQSTNYRNNILKDNSGNPNQLIRIGLNYGLGFAFKLSDKVNVGLEQRFTTAFQDDIDGIRSGQNKDTYSGTELRLNLNLGNASKAVQPLWWVNPNNYLYNELNSPRHLQVKTPPCTDADDDGVCDYLDKEPNTPAGCRVDTHGVTLDTDGDGVPDCKDKEPLTQKSCFPVNADGVGHCPDPECCTKVKPETCNMGSLPTIQFAAGSATLSATAKALLDNVASQLMANPLCSVIINPYGKEGKQNDPSGPRGLAIQNYLVEQKGISEKRVRIVFVGVPPSDSRRNTVDLMVGQ